MIFGYLFGIFKTVYRYPFIYNVTKLSMFGNKIDKTIDWYTDNPIVSVLEEDFILKYSVSFKNYILHCNSETLYDGHSFIKNFKLNSTPPIRRVLSAYLDNGITVTDITEKVKELAGPNHDFFSGSKFEINVDKVIDHGSLIIITDDLNIYRFTSEMIVNINNESMIKIDRHN